MQTQWRSQLTLDKLLLGDDGMDQRIGLLIALGVLGLFFPVAVLVLGRSPVPGGSGNHDPAYLRGRAAAAALVIVGIVLILAALVYRTSGGLLAGGLGVVVVILGAAVDPVRRAERRLSR